MAVRAGGSALRCEVRVETSASGRVSASDCAHRVWKRWSQRGVMLLYILFTVFGPVCGDAKALFAWDFTQHGTGDRFVDSVGGVVATLRAGPSDDGSQNGTMPVRTGAGVQLRGTGYWPSDTNAGGYIDLNLSAVAFGGPTTVEVVATFTPSFNVFARIFECGNGDTDNNVALILQNAVYLHAPSTIAEVEWSVCRGNNSCAAQEPYSPEHSINPTDGRRYPLLFTDVRYHIVATAVNSTLSIYVNSQLSNTTFDDGAGVEPLVIERKRCYIGRSLNHHGIGDGYLNGDISSAKLYSGAMTEAEVRQACENAGVCPRPEQPRKESAFARLWKNFVNGICPADTPSWCFPATFVLILFLCALVAAVVFYEVACLPLFAIRHAFVRRVSFRAALREVCIYQFPCIHPHNKGALVEVDAEGRRYRWTDWRRSRDAHDESTCTFLSDEDRAFRTQVLDLLSDADRTMPDSLATSHEVVS